MKGQTSRRAWAIAVATVLASWALVAGPRAKPATTPSAPSQACSDCHTCEYPSKTEPCLKQLCPRHKTMAKLNPDLGPDTVVLNELENLYEPVVFNHKAHAKMTAFSGGCETCHHFTPPNTPHSACKDCHPTGIQHEDIAQPGLKGAYHRNCMKCHQEWDKDTACQVCHAKKTQEAETVAAVHTSHYRPIELKELILFPTSYAKGDTVPFHHRNHSQLYERDCSECHQQQSCTRCHVQGQKLHPMGTPADTDLHDTCFRCHDNTRCGDCHGRDPDDLFNHRETGWPLKTYHASLNCRACHGQRGPFMELSPNCSTCHPNGWKAATFRHQVTGVALGEVHGELDCGDCHTAGPGSPPTCEGCHDDGRTYDAKKGFGGV